MRRHRWLQEVSDFKAYRLKRVRLVHPERRLGWWRRNRVNESHMIFLPPATASSVEHFAHFIMHYFIEVVLWAQENPEGIPVVRDCGPCTVWLELLAPQAPIKILPKEQLAQLAQAHPSQTIYARHEFSVARGFDENRLQSFRRVMIFDTPPLEAGPGIVAERKIVHPFYKSPQSEIWGGGPTRRSISNHSELTDLIGRNEKMINVDFTELTPRQAIDLSHQAPFLVGQRGAALMNALFLQQGSRVVEILPTEWKSRRSVDLYRNLADGLGLVYRRVWQDDRHGPIDPVKVLEAITN
jgi:hypothetical protein